jgi:nucleoside-diphosphate-sugar epimerase
VLLAGATGMLGDRIAGHLLGQPDVTVRLLMPRPILRTASRSQGRVPSRG